MGVGDEKEPKMVMNIYVITIIFLAPILSLAQDENWREERIDEIEAASHLESYEKIDALKIYLKIGANRYFLRQEMDEDQSVVFEKAKAEIISIPGYADIFERKIKEEWNAFDQEEDFDLKRQRISRLRKNVDIYFQGLSQLPTPEALRVIGDFLSDRRGMPLDEKDRANYLADHLLPNSEYAFVAISLLPLEDRPVPKGKYDNPYFNIDRVTQYDSWCLWYEQVKAGTRTFRFKGDSNIYTLAGPTKEERRPEGGTRSDSAPSERRRHAEPDTSQTSIADSQELSSQSNRYVLIGCLSVLVIGIAAVLRSKRTE